MATQQQKTIAFVLYPGLTLLDLVGQVDRDIYQPMLGPMVQRQLADRPELLAKLSG